ncbi:hypothetical protein ACIGXM_05440 [Kitasatospora sp. NPDC052896]|uniref:hypothetical protein n=1 Tax=Kitasatospora sp. NPDC052896 TaxID=3364061 RepID=UPI0037C6EAC5
MLPTLLLAFEGLPGHEHAVDAMLAAVPHPEHGDVTVVPGAPGACAGRVTAASRSRRSDDRTRPVPAVSGAGRGA